MKIWAGVFVILVACFQLAGAQQTGLSGGDQDFQVDPSQEILIRAYRMLANGTLDEKNKGLAVFRENTDKAVVVDMCVKLLTYFFQNPKFREDDETLYQNDVVAEKLVKILGNTKSQKGFPVYLQIVMTPYIHRNDTVKAAWYSMAAIDW